tara:strand:- start:267 stop:587 length:321 start_codon:yes stop_codon:yes gene_type:complete
MAFNIKKGDTSPWMLSTLKASDGTIIDLSNSTVLFEMKLTSRTDVTISAAAQIIDPDAGTVRYVWSATDTQHAGWYKAEFKVTYQDSTIETFPNENFFWVNVYEDI